MKFTKTTIATGVVLLALAGGAVSGCLTTGDGTVQGIEEMTELEYAKWQLYVTLGVKIGSARLLAEGAITVAELELAATAIELIIQTPLESGTTSLILPALQSVGLTSDEVQLLLLIAEQELLARGALEGLTDPVSGIVELSPRAQELLQRVADSLRGAVAATCDEEAMLGEEFVGRPLTVVAFTFNQ